MLHIFLAALVKASQRTIAIEGIQHSLALRIDDTAGKSCCQRHGKKGTINSFATGQAKGNIGYAHNRVDAPRLHSANNLAGNLGVFGTGGNGQGQGVHYDVAALDTVFSSASDNFISNSNATSRSIGNTTIIQAQRNQNCAIFFGQGQHLS